MCSAALFKAVAVVQGRRRVNNFLLAISCHHLCIAFVFIPGETSGRTFDSRGDLRTGILLRTRVMPPGGCGMPAVAFPLSAPSKK